MLTTVWLCCVRGDTTASTCLVSFPDRLSSACIVSSITREMGPRLAHAMYGAINSTSNAAHSVDVPRYSVTEILSVEFTHLTLDRKLVNSLPLCVFVCVCVCVCGGGGGGGGGGGATADLTFLSAVHPLRLLLATPRLNMSHRSRGGLKMTPLPGRYAKGCIWLGMNLHRSWRVTWV